MLKDIPVFGVCGFKGSGKTTVIESIVPTLRARGLRVAAVKHDVHGIEVDRPRKDSDRIFRAGADVFLAGSEETFLRTHVSTGSGPDEEIRALARLYDLVLVEGYKNTPVPKVWLLGENEKQPPEDVENIVATLNRGSDRITALTSLLNEWLPTQWIKPPVYGCVLIGGSSSRMGKPKHLLPDNDRTWLERTVGILREVTADVVVVGAGDIPKKLINTARLPDVPGAEGPVAGILAAMRWAPWVTWLVTACDLPDLSGNALSWLLSTRAPGVWATIPRLKDGPGAEPVLAHYDFRAGAFLEELVASGNFRVSNLANDERVVSPTPPPPIISAWRNVNSRAELTKSDML